MTVEELTLFQDVAILSFTLIIYSFKSIIIVFTRTETKNTSRDELVKELFKLLDVSSKIRSHWEMIFYQNMISFIQNFKYQKTAIFIYYKG